MRLLLAIAVISAIPAIAEARRPSTVHVKGHWRSDGTYVAPHTRTSPNKTTIDNWSTAPNVNPWTGKQGKEQPKPETPKPNYSGR